MYRTVFSPAIGWAERSWKHCQLQTPGNFKILYMYRTSFANLHLPFASQPSFLNSLTNNNNLTTAEWHAFYILQSNLHIIIPSQTKATLLLFWTRLTTLLKPEDNYLILPSINPSFMILLNPTSMTPITSSTSLAPWCWWAQIPHLSSSSPYKCISKMNNIIQDTNTIVYPCLT